MVTSVEEHQRVFSPLPAHSELLCGLVSHGGPETIEFLLCICLVHNNALWDHPPPAYPRILVLVLSQPPALNL